MKSDVIKTCDKCSLCGVCSSGKWDTNRQAEMKCLYICCFTIQVLHSWFEYIFTSSTIITNQNNFAELVVSSVCGWRKMLCRSWHTLSADLKDKDEVMQPQLYTKNRTNLPNAFHTTSNWKASKKRTTVGCNFVEIADFLGLENPWCLRQDRLSSIYFKTVSSVHWKKV